MAISTKSTSGPTGVPANPKHNPKQSMVPFDPDDLKELEAHVNHLRTLLYLIEVRQAEETIQRYIVADALEPLYEEIKTFAQGIRARYQDQGGAR